MSEGRDISPPPSAPLFRLPNLNYRRIALNMAQIRRQNEMRKTMEALRGWDSQLYPLNVLLLHIEPFPGHKTLDY